MDPQKGQPESWPAVLLSGQGKGAIGFQGWRLTRPLVPVGLIRMCSKFFSSELSSNRLCNGFREADLLSRYVGSEALTTPPKVSQSNKQVRVCLVQCEEAAFFRLRNVTFRNRWLLPYRGPTGPIQGFCEAGWVRSQLPSVEGRGRS